jgi:hypothetical protein
MRVWKHEPASALELKRDRREESRESGDGMAEEEKNEIEMEREMEKEEKPFAWTG